MSINPFKVGKGTNVDTLFSTLLEEEMHSGKTKIPIHNFPCVHKDDYEPVSLIDPCIKKGPWIAGGAPLRWFVGQPVGSSDIDVFCADEKQADKLVARIKRINRFTIMAKTDNAISIRYHSYDNKQSWLIQVIYCRMFPTLQDVIDSFDISVCQVGTAGDEWILGEHTALDLRKKQLRFTKNLREDSLKRLLKYWTYGFRPIEGTIEAFQTNNDVSWKLNPSENYSNAF